MTKDENVVTVLYFTGSTPGAGVTGISGKELRAGTDGITLAVVTAASHYTTFFPWTSVQQVITETHPIEE